MKWLDEQGIQYWELRDEVIRRQGYLTYEQLTQKLKQIVSQNSHIAKLISIGKTVEGREMWFVKLSDQVEIDQPEPEVKLVGNMHGNEVAGQEILSRFIKYLTDNYGIDDNITQIIDETEIWIMPNMNPDGTHAGIRANAQGIDLNRDFPFIFEQASGNINHAVETIHMIEFSNLRNFILSANLHGGAVVVNYPWDSKVDQIPDYEVAVQIAKDYAILNDPMYQSVYFDDGITNGYQWYEIWGSMQDWNYYWKNCLSFTLEVSELKWPAFETIEFLWNDNKDSLISMVSIVHKGLKGVVVDEVTGIPVAANIWVHGIDRIIYNAMPQGEFTLLLTEGNYNVVFQSQGYISKEISVEIDGQWNQVIEVELTRE